MLLEKDPQALVVFLLSLMIQVIMWGVFCMTLGVVLERVATGTLPYPPTAPPPPNTVLETQPHSEADARRGPTDNKSNQPAHTEHALT